MKRLTSVRLRFFQRWVGGIVSVHGRVRTVTKTNGSVTLSRSVLFASWHQSELIRSCIKSSNMSRVWESTMSERTARYWFQKFRLGDLSFWDEPRNGRPHVLDDEALQATIQEDSCITMWCTCKTV
ncbi:hypothetical protein NPIL_619381 [Nephila pilipes]|uniref:Mos1 transposase HTH domain-containing protein n=1 Tax=Nephila pilipes TaxID=299642 RepID=A0A8X6MNA7_NEPPI|nr:hypothetical protein NPIL_619381 [Nephila pilipes]